VTASERTLSPSSWRLLCVSGVFALSVALSNTFVNVYLWKLDRTFAAIGWFNLMTYLLMPVGFWWAGRVAAERGSAWTLRGGIAGHVLFYALTLWGGESAAAHPALLGSVLGLAGGWYWYSYNVLSLRLTGMATNARFFGLNGMFGAVAGMVAPPLAGALISYEDRLGGLSGYHLVFGLSLALFVGAALLSLGLRTEGGRDPLDLGAARQALRRPRWRLLLAACLVYGLREGVFLFLIGILFFIHAGSEWRLGTFAFIQSLLSSLSFYTVGKAVDPHNRRAVQWTGALCMAGAALLFLRPVTAGLLVVYGIVISVVLPLFLLPLQTLVFDSIVHVGGGTHPGAYFIVREAFANAGRVLGIGLFLGTVATGGPSRIPVLVMGLGMVQLGACSLLSVGGVGEGIRRAVDLVRGATHGSGVTRSLRRRVR
jgi:YQGE family putative transporter